MEEILHLNYNPGPAGWILRLQTQLQGSASITLRDRYSKWKDFGMAEIGMAFATRLALRQRAAYLLARLLNDLRNEISSSGKLDELLDGGYAYYPDDDRIFYDICVALDALYFETRSAYEIVGKFVQTFGKKILNRNFSEKDIQKILVNEGQKTDWINEVQEHRKLFFHETAPWIALSISKRDPLEFSLIIMKENLKEFDNPEKYITQQQLFDSWQGFDRAISTICEWLKEQIIAFEKNEQRKHK